MTPDELQEMSSSLKEGFLNAKKPGDGFLFIGVTEGEVIGFIVGNGPNISASISKLMENDPTLRKIIAHAVLQSK